jgi:hypothetical protein
MVLTDAGKEELALALLLWKDFKTQPPTNSDDAMKVTIQMFQFADKLTVRKQLEEMMSKLPPMRIVPR